MDNPTPTTDNHAHASNHPDMQADIASAKLAWEAWKSNDPKQIDHALEERHRLLKEDPKAWKKAMKEIDADEKRQAEAKAELQRELQAEQAANAAAAAAARASATPANDAAPPAPPVVTGDAQVSQSAAVAPPANSADNLAPPPPDTPGYNAAYNQPPAKFYGLNFGLFKIGVNSHGSLDGGINIPHIFQGEGELGLETGGRVEVFPGFKPLHARANAAVGINKDGFHGEGGAGANVLNLAGGDLDVGARLGNNTGVDGDFRGKALIAEGQGSAGLSLDERGLGVHGGGNADILKALGARGGGRFAIGPHSGGAAGVGLDVAGNTLDFGPQSDGYIDGTSIVGLHLDPGKSGQPTFYPTGDRQVDAP